MMTVDVMKERTLELIGKVLMIGVWAAGGVMLLLWLTGCSIKTGVAIGPERWQVISVQYEGNGGETFCLGGLDLSIAHIGPIGWGTHECSGLPQD